MAIKQIHHNREESKLESVFAQITPQPEGLTQHISPLSMCNDNYDGDENNKDASIQEAPKLKESEEKEANYEYYQNEENMKVHQKELRELFQKEIPHGLSIAQTLKFLNKIAPTSEDYLEGYYFIRVQITK